MRCPTSPTRRAGTSRRSAPNGPGPSRRPISTGARSRSMAARTRSRRTSSPRRSWDSDMDFDLSDEQRLLKDSVERLLADRYGFEQRRVYAGTPEGWSREIWAHYAELGLLGLPFAEEHGGFGGGPVETMIAFEAFGRALALEPYLATVVLGGGFLRHGASDEQRSELIPKIAGGGMTLALAHNERQARY